MTNTPFNNKKIRSSAFFVFSVLLAITFLLENSAEARKRRRSRDPIIVHRLLNLKGTAFLDGLPAPEFAGIKEGMMFDTKDDSMLVARIVGLGLVRMGDNSQIKISKFLNRDKFRMDFFKGDVLIYIKRPGEHQIVVGDQVIHVTEETALRLRSPKTNGPLDICTCSGKFTTTSKQATTAPPSLSAAAQIPTTQAAMSAGAPPTVEAVNPEKRVDVCCQGIDMPTLDSLYALP